jgi:nucleotide-binding universal stress UspA family protein
MRPSSFPADSPADIVVGYDGSAHSRAALRYAMTQAQRLDAPVRIVTAFDYDWHPSRFAPLESVDQIERTVRGRFDELVEAAIAEVRARFTDVTVTGEVRRGSPGPVLVDASLDAGRHAALVVVGNRGHGGFGGLMLGSVGQYVATHARSPVTVVRGSVDTAVGPVIVGADSSERADHTIGVAFEEAARRGAGLIAIRAYELPTAYGLMAMGTAPFNPEEIRRAESDALADSVRPWREKFPAVEVETVIARGSAGRVLVGASSTAGLVVVGSHGHGAIAGTLLGSVSLQVLNHADCPVLIVRS